MTTRRQVLLGSAGAAVAAATGAFGWPVLAKPGLGITASTRPPVYGTWGKKAVLLGDSSASVILPADIGLAAHSVVLATLNAATGTLLRVTLDVPNNTFTAYLGAPATDSSTFIAWMVLG